MKSLSWGGSEIPEEELQRSAAQIGESVDMTYCPTQIWVLCKSENNNAILNESQSVCSLPKAMEGTQQACGRMCCDLSKVNIWAKLLYPTCGRTTNNVQYTTLNKLSPQ